MARLIITADDYGYAPSYDAGILEAARGGAVDAVSAMVLRDGIRPEPLIESGVEVGLHLELDPASGVKPRRLAEAGEAPVCHVDLALAGDADRSRAERAILAQLERFEALFGRPAAYLDGHHQAHARPGLGTVVANIARDRQLAVRSVDDRQRRLLRCKGVPTPDRLVGRMSEFEPALPPELAPDTPPLDGVIEWMVHPGHPDPSTGSSYDRGRGEDLELLLRFEPPTWIRRATHRSALQQG